MTADAKKLEPNVAEPAADAPVKKQALREFFAKIKTVWNPKQEVFFVRILILLCVATLASMGTATLVFVKINCAAHPKIEIAKVDEAEEEAEPAKDGKEPEEQAVLGGSKIPKSILERRKGELEPGHDLIEPEIESTRSISSFLKSDLKVDLGARYIELDEIFTSLRSGKSYDGKLILNVSLEVNSTEIKTEIEKRSTEIRSLIASLASEHQKERIMTTEGILEFKEEIYREIALLVGSGKVTDVLITSFTVR